MYALLIYEEKLKPISLFDTSFNFLKIKIAIKTSNQTI
jgi:hypothetical protein